jgi:endo-1,4-beta-xylanase
VKAQANILVAESEFKFGPLRPTPTTYFFDDADYLVKFAEDNGMKVRGHNFVWHRQIPGWFASYVTAANAQQVLVDHIETVGRRYAGKIQSWDVVNEAIQVDDGLPGGMRNSPWQKVLPGYIDIAFRTAREADPKAMLVYNDYGIEEEDAKSSAKRAAVLDLVRGMQKRGVPIDAVGIQSHISAGPAHVYGGGLRKFMSDVQSMGLKILLTELDVNDRELPPRIPERDAAVGRLYADYLKLTLANTAVIALLTWGITDRYTWLNHEGNRKDGLPERCLPFDGDLKPTAAFDAEIGAILGAPRR